MQENGYVNLEIKNKVGYISFFHPKSNSLPSEILSKLAQTITEAGNNSEINVIVLQSDGDRAFCAGASFDELINIENFDVGKKFFMGFANVINAMRSISKFVIVRVHGKAVGGGVGLASAGDYTFATKESAVKLSEFALGIGPFVVGPAVERKIGKSAFSQMSIDTDWYSAEWAFNKGLYAHIFNSKDELSQAVIDFAEKLSKLSPPATLELKQIFWEGTSNWNELLEQRAEISGKLILSDFSKDYIKQFKSK